MELSEANRSLNLARRKGEDALKMYSYQLYVNLLQRNYRGLQKEFNRKPQLSGMGYYTRYWLMLLKGDIAAMNNSLQLMLKGDNYFARAYALSEFMRRGIIDDPDTKFREYVKFFNLSYDMNIEEQRAAVYSDLINRRYHLALLQIKALIKEHPAFIELYVDLLHVLNATHDRVVAMEFLLDPVFVDIFESDPRLIYLLSREFYRYERYDKARYYLTELMSLVKSNPIFHYNMGNVYSASHRYAKAIREYQECLSVAPYFERAHYNLGTIYLHEGYRNEAYRHLSEAQRLKRRPDNTYNLSVCLVKSRNLEEAYRHLQDCDVFLEPFKEDAIYIRDHIREAIITA